MEKKKVVLKPKEENFEIVQDHFLDISLSHNNEKIKTSLDWKNIGGIIFCIIALVCSSFLIIYYLDNGEENSKNPSSTKNSYEVITTERKSDGESYENTTKIQTQATHTVIDRNR